jgi:hypothetical protein
MSVGRARKLRQLVHLMADYGSTGVWDHDRAPLDPAGLPLSTKLQARLARWTARGEIDLNAFAAAGRAIARAVKAELPDWSIVYFDEAAAAQENYRGARSEYEVEMP